MEFFSQIFHERASLHTQLPKEERDSIYGIWSYLMIPPNNVAAMLSGDADMVCTEHKGHLGNFQLVETYFSVCAVVRFYVGCT